MVKFFLSTPKQVVGSINFFKLMSKPNFFSKSCRVSKDGFCCGHCTESYDIDDVITS